MIIFFKFTIFLFLNYLSGKVIFSFIKKKINFNEKLIFGISESTFYPIINLIAIGNLSFIINFFVPVKSGYLFIAFLTPALYLNIKFDGKLKLLNFIQQKKYFKIENLFNLIAIFFLSLSTYSISMSHDAGLYHLSNQLWIQNSKLNFGLALLHKRFGYSSIYDYINSNFWLFDDLVYLHFVNLLFFHFFFKVLIDLFINNKFNLIAYGFLIYGILDNFGFNGGKNGFVEIETVGKYDSPCAIIFVISLYLLFNIIKSNQESFKFENFIILILILFSIQLRPTGLLLIPIFIYSTIHKLGLKGLLNIFRFPNILIFLLSLLWFIKNLSISSCVIFPINFLCYEKFLWSYNGLAKKEVLEISNLYNAYHFDENIFDWFNKWQENNLFNVSTLKNFLIAYFILFLLVILFSSFNNRKRENYFLKLFCSFFLLGYYFLSVPDTRFGIVIYCSLIYLLLDSFELKSYNFFYTKFIFGFLFFLCLFSVPRFENYKLFISNPLSLGVNFELQDYLKNDSEYTKRTNGYGYIPINDNSCWLRIDCSPSYENDTILVKRFGYNVFVLR